MADLVDRLVARAHGNGSPKTDGAAPPTRTPPPALSAPTTTPIQPGQGQHEKEDVPSARPTEPVAAVPTPARGAHQPRETSPAATRSTAPRAIDAPVAERPTSRPAKPVTEVERLRVVEIHQAPDRAGSSLSDRARTEPAMPVSAPSIPATSLPRTVPEALLAPASADRPPADPASPWRIAIQRELVQARPLPTAAPPTTVAPAGESHNRGAESPSVVQVHIGRVEVNSSTSTNPGPPPKSAPAAMEGSTVLSLSDYLRHQAHGGGQ